MHGSVTAVSRSGEHGFSKQTRPSIRLLAGLGVEGDAHLGVTVQHLSRVRQDPAQPNLRQVHLIATELLEEVRVKGYAVAPGQLGENVTTTGLDLLGLPTGTRLRLGAEAVVEVTGLRNPCAQIDGFRKGLLKEVVHRDEAGDVRRKAGVMAVVVDGGEVRPGDPVTVELPAEPHRPLERV
ncbi:MOSC domain-containing protein [Streptomyces meridianus]|uniref:MOSC domain-containing protein n=1 Tax=Streptomyces meridianus TaxID=2938945 RepID=A0ABT0XAK7_9ACTN|nr:MOSC domain-containing protein [Streptomyces meridianus]MCM2579566.1 MOSC domain-containing protein [Streptomyces meridianus]